MITPITVAALLSIATVTIWCGLAGRSCAGLLETSGLHVLNKR